MTDKPHKTPADPNVEPEGYVPPTSAEELLERYKTRDRFCLDSVAACSRL